MKILVTGASGFIGSHVLMSLLDEGHEITALVRSKSKVPALESTPRVQVIEAEITDYETIAKIIPTHDACVHVALNYNDSSAYQMLMHDSAPSVFLASECAKAGVRHFIYTSSTAALDSLYEGPLPEPISPSGAHATTNTKQCPHTYYGATKAATENFLMAIAGSTNMKVAIIRPGYTFGNPALEGGYSQPDQRFHSIIKAIKHNKDVELTLYDGTQFIWAPHLASIYTAALRKGINKQVYFGLSQNFTSWETIALEAKKITGSSSNIITKDLGWNPTPLLFDVSDIQRDFNFKFNSQKYITKHIEHLLTIV